MENRFNNSDFEQFVKQSADQYRMFPSEKVWNGIHNTLHTRRRWYGIGVALLLLTTATVTWIMFINPSSKQEQLANTPIAATTKDFIEQKFETPAVVIAPEKLNRTKPSFVASPGNQQENLFLADAGSPVILSADVSYTTDIDNNLTTDIQPEHQPVTATAISNNPVLTTKIVTVISKPLSPAIVANKPGRKSTPIINDNITVNKTIDFPVSIVDNNEIDKKEELTKTAAPVEERSFAVTKDIYPFTIESVTNSYIKLAKKRKLSWEIYFLPTISYRKLAENKSFLLNSQVSNAPINVNTAVNDGINNVVTHKPDVGLEAGFNVGFPVSKNFKFTTGLQVNVSKYDIIAYPYQREEARIALSNEYGRTQVSNITTTYRAQESFTKPHWLSNYYVSASLPIGAELIISRFKANSGYMGIGSTIQPTYTLSDRAYIISTDFKNYAKVPSLTRDWNLNSSFEIFAGYSTKKFDWKIGPQVRYQLLSSFDKKYPVKEHLMNFGLKVAVILNK